MKTKPIEEWYPEKIRTGVARIGTEVLEKRRRSKMNREERVVPRWDLVNCLRKKKFLEAI